MAVSPSLFDPPVQSAFQASADWLAQLLTGSLVIALCVVAVAFIGLMLMTGHLSWRQSLRVMLGCFVLLGAPAISLALQGAVNRAARQEPVSEPPSPPTQTQSPLPPSNYDPYAGASFRPQ